MPRKMLCSTEMSPITEKHLSGKQEWEKKEVSVPISFIETIDINVTYFYNKNKNFVIIPTPLAVKEGRGEAAEPSYEKTIQAIEKQVGNENFGLGCALLGKGTGERHYTALFKEEGANGKIAVFDSKISDPNQFFNSSDSPGFFEKVWGVIKAPFKAFGLWAFGIGNETQSSFLGKDVTVHRLATQPFFDGVSCGLHSAGAILNMIDVIDAPMSNKGITIEEITSSITSDKHLDLKAESALNSKNEVIPAMNGSLGSLLLSNEYNSDKSHQYDYKEKNEVKPRRNSAEPQFIQGQGNTDLPESNDTLQQRPTLR
jgi:hypothetical protein